MCVHNVCVCVCRTCLICLRHLSQKCKWIFLGGLLQRELYFTLFTKLNSMIDLPRIGTHYTLILNATLSISFAHGMSTTVMYSWCCVGANLRHTFFATAAAAPIKITISRLNHGEKCVCTRFHAANDFGTAKKSM